MLWRMYLLAVPAHFRCQDRISSASFCSIPFTAFCRPLFQPLGMQVTLLLFWALRKIEGKPSYKHALNERSGSYWLLLRKLPVWSTCYFTSMIYFKKFITISFHKCQAPLLSPAQAASCQHFYTNAQRNPDLCLTDLRKPAHCGLLHLCFLFVCLNLCSSETTALWASLGLQRTTSEHWWYTSYLQFWIILVILSQRKLICIYA